MRKIVRRVKDERGVILVWTGVVLGALVAFAGLATDVPYLYVARRQAQTAADAGSIGGAYGLFVSETQAVTEGKVIAGRTPVMGQLLASAQVDVFVESSSDSVRDQVRCLAYRDLAHNNPLPLFLLPVLQLFGRDRTTADVSATATARLVNSCSSGCFKPWLPPDKWIDANGNGQFDQGIDTYIPPGQPGATGYKYPEDQGVQITLKVGSPNDAPMPSVFLPIDFPALNRGNPITGASAYENNIATCGSKSFLDIGDQVQVEPGDMKGPTKHGVETLINQDPTASWDTACNCLKSPLGVNSPRLVRIPFSDPRDAYISGRTSRIVANVGGVFLESIQPNGDVIGRYTWVPSMGGASNPSCSLVRLVQLVR